MTIFDIWSGARVTKSFLLGLAAIAQGDLAKARPFLETEARFAEQELREMPDSPTRQAQLGIVYAYLGRKADAIAAGQRALELMPVRQDAYDGPAYLLSLAQIYARTGETEKSIELIEKLLKIPNGMTQYDLRDWTWDPLRNDQSFQKLVGQD